MKTRFITGIFITTVYIAVGALTIFVHPIFFDIFTFFLAAAGTYELARAMSRAYSPAIVVLDYIAVVLGFGSFWFAQYFFNSYASGMTAYFISLAAMIVVTLIMTAASKQYVKGNATTTIFIMMYPTALLMFSVGINYFMDVAIGLSSARPFRNVGIMLMLLVPTFTDIAAYLVGSKLKGKKLCPSISPNKTVSGAIGGLFGGMLASGILLAIMAINANTSANLIYLQMINESWAATIVNMLVLGLLGSVFDQAGDLFASLIKRRTGIKDYSNLMPGHGGVLDRVDGYIFCGVFFYMYFAVMILLV